MSNETEQLYKAIAEVPRVVGYMIISYTEAIPIRTTLSEWETRKYVGYISALIPRARKAVRAFVIDEEENVDDDVTFIRVRTLSHEILIAPGEDDKYAMVVIQKRHERPLDKEKEGEAAEEGEEGTMPAGKAEEE